MLSLFLEESPADVFEPLLRDDRKEPLTSASNLDMTKRVRNNGVDALILRNY